VRLRAHARHDRPHHQQQEQQQGMMQVGGAYALRRFARSVSLAAARSASANFFRCPSSSRSSSASRWAAAADLTSCSSCSLLRRALKACGHGRAGAVLRHTATRMYTSGHPGSQYTFEATQPHRPRPGCTLNGQPSLPIRHSDQPLSTFLPRMHMSSFYPFSLNSQPFWLTPAHLDVLL